MGTLIWATDVRRTWSSDILMVGRVSIFSKLSWWMTSHEGFSVMSHPKMATSSAFVATYDDIFTQTGSYPRHVSEAPKRGFVRRSSETFIISAGVHVLPVRNDGRRDKPAKATFANVGLNRNIGFLLIDRKRTTLELNMYYCTGLDTDEE
jgi:hypothetical protein